ncbi:MAG: serine hydrolase domain-containing protein [Caldilineaceae bacterium]
MVTSHHLLSDDLGQILNESLQNVYHQEGLPSLSALLVKDDKILWHGTVGYADLEQKRRADDQTIYGIGSITKVFTALMLLQLWDAHKLALDEPVARYLPELKQLPTGAAITFRQLASHTAGLPIMPPLPELAEVMQEFPPTIESLRQMRFPTGQQVLALLPLVTPLSAPGAQVAYSNLGVALLTYALERIAGQPYVAYVMEHILQPLGMVHSGFAAETLPAVHLATCYLPFTTPPVAAPTQMKDIQGFVATGALNASGGDMARFLIGLFANAQSTILSSRSRHAMIQPVAHLSASRYTNRPTPGGVGIGWFLSSYRNHVILEHGGADPSTAAYLAYVPNLGLGVFAATNTGNPTAVATMAADFLELIITHLETDG